MKKYITRETILEPYKTDVKFLRIFQIVGAVIAFAMMLLFFIGVRINNETKWEYLGVAIFVFILFMIIPMKVSKKSREMIHEIGDNQFSIDVDVITNKDADTKKDKGTGNYTWEYSIEGSMSGELPLLNKADWDACEIGSEIYVINNNEGKPLMSFPLSAYSLSDDLIVYVNKKQH